MKILVSTKDGQGLRKNDFCFCNEGELVRFAVACDGEEIDGGCGCRRSMTGVESHTATTTLKVVDLNITPDEYFAKIGGALVAAYGACISADSLRKYAIGMTQELMQIADSLPLDVVIEKRGDDILCRELVA